MVVVLDVCVDPTGDVRVDPTGDVRVDAAGLIFVADVVNMDCTPPTCYNTTK